MTYHKNSELRSIFLSKFDDNMSVISYFPSQASIFKKTY